MNYKLSLKKTINFFKLVFSYLISSVLRKPIHWGMPMSLSIEPTNYCNLQCPECPTGNQTLTRKKGFINPNLFYKVVDELHEYLINLFVYFEGEPYLHPQLTDLLHYANSKNIYTVISTNGHFLSQENILKTLESGLDKLIISLDGTTQEVYNQYRKGGNLETVIEGIQLLIAKKQALKVKKPFVEIQFLVLGTNEHQIADIKRLAKDLNVDKLRFKSAQINDYQHGSKFIPSLKTFARYHTIATNSYTINSTLSNRCWRIWNSSVITLEGDVVPCCFDKDAHFSMGNLVNQSFKEIWTNEKQVQFRQRIFHQRKAIDMCCNCVEGLS